MNFRILLFLFFGFVFFTSCISPKFTGETQLVRPSESGTIHISAGGYGKTKPEAMSNAIENAFKNILIHGIPNSNQSRPMLGSNAEKTFLNNKHYFKKFFESDAEQYILQRDLSKFKFFNINTPSIEVRLLINTASLRRHLENDKIIRSLGY